eukprot:13487929-Ditylum_brightwellii.AAC.1
MFQHPLGDQYKTIFSKEKKAKKVIKLYFTNPHKCFLKYSAPQDDKEQCSRMHWHKPASSAVQ